MKKLYGLIILLLVLSSFQALAQKKNPNLALKITSTIPAKISYQGVLTDNNGSPLTGSYNMDFGLYNASSGGTELWTESQTVPVINGIFNVYLGAGNPISDTIDRKSTRLNSSHSGESRMPSSA